MRYTNRRILYFTLLCQTFKGLLTLVTACLVHASDIQRANQQRSQYHSRLAAVNNPQSVS